MLKEEINKKFWSYIRKEGKKFREKKINELLKKENPDDFEISIVRKWLECYA